jgi:hypothetical protein
MSFNVLSNACSCSDISIRFSFPSYLILHCFDWLVHSEAQISLNVVVFLIATHKQNYEQLSVPKCRFPSTLTSMSS